MIVRSRAPLRLGLAGGGTDVSPYCDQFGGAVLNVTVNLYVYTVLEPTDDGQVRFFCADIDGAFQAKADPCLEVAYPLILHRAVYRRIVTQFNSGRPLSCRITTYCDAPPGSGLGTSSTLVVSLLNAFVAWLSLPLRDYEIAQLAFEIERGDAGLKGGRQDQYAATFGGVNFMEFYPEERVVVNPLRVNSWILSELETSLVLFNSGVSRSSAAIIETQTTNLASGTGTTLEALHEIKADAFRMKECLLKGDISGFARVMGKSWEAKKRLADSISNHHIDDIHEAAMAAGALAGKVSGAGGGGFMTFLVDPSRRGEVIRALSKQAGRIMTCTFTGQGAESWKIL
jgi:D-glycero-alpha-D-manno-heptose-7-phosphate kinase